MKERREPALPQEQDPLRYRADIERIVQNIENHQWVTFANKETAVDPRFFEALGETLRENNHIPVFIEPTALPSDKKELHVDDIEKLLLQRLEAGLGDEEASVVLRRMTTQNQNAAPPRERFFKLLWQLSGEGKHVTLIWKRLEEILGRIPEGPERDKAAINLFHSLGLKGATQGTHYVVTLADPAKWEEMKVDRRAFSGAVYSPIKT